LHQTIKSIVEGLYDPIHFGEADIPALMNYIRADKKNNHDKLLFSMAFAPGECDFNISESAEAVIQVLNQYVGHTN
jgi:3-dehydroquinate synthetase